ncbi:MAG: efflux RND transporter permease subunit [Algicola sp.]|nr:efflux RND transporter permease subunit [Algicola sp.]
MNKYQSMGASLATFAIKRPVTTTMFFVSMLLLGIISSRLLPLEKWPGIDIPQLFINVPYPNSTPAEVERLITRPLEEALATISGIERLRSRSSENGANVNVQFKWDDNIGAKSIEAREKIDAIRHLLPKDVQRVLVYQFNTADMPVFKLRISSERDLSMAYDLLERNLKRPIERVQGVSKVEMYGVDKRQIMIRLDSDKISSLRINTQELAQKLRKFNFSMTAGHFFANDNKILVNPIGEFQSIDEIRDLIVADNVRLKDIATINLELPIKEEGRHLNQTYAIGIDIFKESSVNLVEVASRVLDVIAETNSNPQFSGINLFIMDNMAEGVTDSLSALLSAGLIGALLSIIVLYGFLRNVATTLIVVLSVPFSIFITLGVMYLLGYSLNILSMMGLMLAVGMLVDNAVVITESIFHEKENIKDSLQATKAGVSKVSLAIIAGTATTAIVFLPNVVGAKVQLTIFLSHVAISIIISLFASLLIAQTLIPLLASKIKHTPMNKQQKEPSKLYQRYAKSLNWVMDHQKATGFIALLLLASIAIPMSVVSSDGDRDNNNERISLNYNIISTYSVEEVERTVTKMEEYLYAHQDEFYIESVYSYYNTNFAYSSIKFKPGIPIKMSELKDKIKADWPTLVRGNPQFGWSSTGASGVSINLLGNSTDELISIADNLIPILSSIEGLEDVTSDVASEKKELQVQVDRTIAHRLGLTTADVANAISTALRGNNLRSFRHADIGEIDVMLNFDIEVSKSIDALRKLPILRMDNQIFTLEGLAKISITRAMDDITRLDRQTGITISGNLHNDLKIEEAKKQIKSVLENIVMPPGNTWSLDGSFRRQNEDMKLMGQNMILAVIMIYIVMAALFESLLLPTAVITSLLFSIVGVFWAFLLTGTSISVMGMVGILILMGIVVNNGIVLVDRINQLVIEGEDLRHAIVNGCLSRVRPIMMTVATTVLGLVPLAIGTTQIGGDGPPYSPMAIAIIGGLTFSTVTSLYLVPLAYILLLKMRYRVRMLKLSSQRVLGRIFA